MPASRNLCLPSLGLVSIKDALPNFFQARSSRGNTESGTCIPPPGLLRPLIHPAVHSFIHSFIHKTERSPGSHAAGRGSAAPGPPQPISFTYVGLRTAEKLCEARRGPGTRLRAGSAPGPAREGDRKTQLPAAPPRFHLPVRAPATSFRARVPSVLRPNVQGSAEQTTRVVHSATALPCSGNEENEAAVRAARRGCTGEGLPGRHQPSAMREEPGNEGRDRGGTETASRGAEGTVRSRKHRAGPQEGDRAGALELHAQGSDRCHRPQSATY